MMKWGAAFATHGQLPSRTALNHESAGATLVDASDRIG